MQGRRLVILFSLFLFCFAFLLLHLAVIQLGRGSEYAFLALERETRSVLLEEYPRGEILDRRLQPLTGSFDANRVVVFPGLIRDRQAVITSLAGILGLPVGKIAPYFDGQPCYLPFSLTPGQVKAIREHQWPGVLVLPVHLRYGPTPLAAGVVGYLGRVQSREVLDALSVNSRKSYSLSDWVGQAGLEKYYEGELKATRPKSAARLFVDAAGRPIPGLGLAVDLQSVDPGRQHLVTTLDAGIQRVVEEIMDRRIKKGAVVVMEPHTGDILALASRPVYDPRPHNLPEYLALGEKGTFTDQTTALFTPGSVFKVVVAAAALAEGIVNPGSQFNCRGSLDQPVRCWYDPGHGVISFSRAFAESCNPVFARVGLELGAGKLIEYAGRFGLDNQTITGYPVPRDGRQNWQLVAAPHNLVNSSLGQGPVLATPVQITAMMSVIVNDGVYIQPRLVRELRNDAGQVTRSFPLGPSHRAIPASTAAQVREMLQLVTTEGVGRQAYVPGYGSAGKTGSAQVDGRGKVNAWFTGYAPLQDPRYVVTVLVQEGISGGETAAPVFREIVEKILTLPPE
ncbi:penicillin-binding protein 2 [Desulfofundulus sp. TPOSR]|uniref:peptidoglycan D,D-transpeptidase FtsI family protein n=1 Tax=Desulfofundulus sp. TPOSR TaxID=2714340 RepID=UPI00140945A5|nr:penicillin-binding transpeptidase domain-containing protein [Desulfofundulus sp. TPOSR]NHM27764.1 penicillin-binding protein 2 [Desulfofundulus sp. TPOSR]